MLSAGPACHESGYDTMLDALLHSLRYDRAETVEILRRIPEEAAFEQPAGLAQSPGWIAAHLNLADTIAGRRLGVETDSPIDELFGAFGPESDTSAARERVAEFHGSYAGVVDAAVDSHQRLLSAVAAAPAELLKGPHPEPKVREYFPTLEHHLAYTVWHEGNHGGQLRAWMHVARNHGIVTAG